MLSPAPCRNCGEMCKAKTGLCRTCYKQWWYNNPEHVAKRANTRRCDTPLTPSQVPEAARPGLDFSKQERRPVVDGKSQTAMHIFACCTECGKERWILQKKAKIKQTGLCLACTSKKPNRNKPKGKGWFVTAGYKFVDIDRFYPEYADYIREHLQHSYYNRFYKEHRIVALLKYGPSVIHPDIVIRHIDGNKLNNAPENLIPGTNAENRQDHAQAVAEMLRWRAIALMLFDALCHRPRS